MDYFSKSAEVLKSLNSQLEEIDVISRILKKRLNDGKKILIAGNGGSSADSQHFAGELTCTFNNRNRQPYSAISLMDNNSALSAWSNDFNFNSYIERQLMAFGSKDDVFFVLSTSGGSKESKQSLNLINACLYAKENNILVISLVGKDGGELHKISDHSIKVESKITSHIQEAHIAIIHYICNFLDY